MDFTYPHTIENSFGEKLIFKRVQPEPDGDPIIGENFVVPGVGPPMHVHWPQDEGFTVVRGKIGNQVRAGPSSLPTKENRLCLNAELPTASGMQAQKRFSARRGLSRPTHLYFSSRPSLRLRINPGRPSQSCSTGPI